MDCEKVFATPLRTLSASSCLADALLKPSSNCAGDPKQLGETSGQPVTQTENFNARALGSETRDTVSLSGVIQRFGIDNNQILATEMHGGIVHRIDIGSPETLHVFHGIEGCGCGLRFTMQAAARHSGAGERVSSRQQRIQTVLRCGAQALRTRVRRVHACVDHSQPEQVFLSSSLATRSVSLPCVRCTPNLSAGPLADWSASRRQVLQLYLLEAAHHQDIRSASDVQIVEL